jgi:hypothetical protein
MRSEPCALPSGPHAGNDHSEQKAKSHECSEQAARTLGGLIQQSEPPSAFCRQDCQRRVPECLEQGLLAVAAHRKLGSGSDLKEAPKTGQFTSLTLANGPGGRGVSNSTASHVGDRFANRHLHSSRT